MNENCYEAVYSEDYADYIVEYNGDRQVLEEIYSNACLFLLITGMQYFIPKREATTWRASGTWHTIYFPSCWHLWTRRWERQLTILLLFCP